MSNQAIDVPFLRLASAAQLLEHAGSQVPLASRDAALLAWLAIEGPTSRTRLAQLLWPDSEPKTGRNSLRQRLFKLKRQTGVDLVVGTATLALAAGVSHDLHDADSVLGDSRDAIGAEFDAWLALQHTRRHERVGLALVELCDAAERAADWADALIHAGELLTLDTLSEAAHCRVMRLHYLAGDRAAALRAFDRCEQMLKNEVGTAPSSETLALLATIEQSNAEIAGPDSPALPSRVPTAMLRPPRLIGRDNELTLLRQGWQAAEVVALIGEAGMGKTRLLQAFVESQHGVVRAAGRPGDAGVPFATLTRLLRAVLTRDGLPLQHELPLETRSELARVLPEFDAPGSRHSGEGQRLVMQRAIRLLLATQSSLSGLVVDDLHFADEASLEMLRSLIDEDRDPPTAAAPALRWALAYRPADAGSPVQSLHDALAEQARLLPVVLAPLDETALAALVDSLALPGVDGTTLAPGLARRTGGNPLFVLETLKQAWVERTLARLAVDGALPRPVSVGRLIERRIAQLSPAALALARVASIAGTDFSVGMAEHVLQASAMRFADALNELEAAQVMRGDAFAHDLVFDAVRASVPATIAVHTHAGVAAYLEPLGAEPARIAQHWIEAKQPQRALVWLEQAADRARRGLRIKEYIGFMERKSAIHEASGDNAAAFESQLLAAQEFVNVDRTSALGQAHFARLDHLASTPIQRIETLLLRSRFEQELDGSRSVDSARDALRQSQRLGDARLIALSHRALSTVLYAADRLPEAAQHYEACVDWVDAHGSVQERSDLHSDVAGLYDNIGRLQDALPHHELAIELAQQCGNRSHAAVVLANFACNRIDAGDLVAAQGHLQRSLQITALHDGFGASMGAIHMMLVLCACQSGRYIDALMQAELAMSLMEQHACNHLEVSHLRQAMCWRHLGQWARVQQTLDSSVVQAGTRLAAVVHVAVLRHHLDLALGRNPGDTLAQALAAMPAHDRPDLRLPLLIEHAQTLPAEAALRQLDDVCVQAQALQHEGTVLAAHVRAAGIAADVDPPKAALHAQAALALAERRRSSTLLPAELWLHCARALLAAGQTQHARSLLSEGCGWVQRTARDHVPEAFRDGFVNRNAVNRELLALAARVCE
jgi:DNA-binding SARP family transcriptional activator/tetratricopeptide (TPR) repeat protein